MFSKSYVPESGSSGQSQRSGGSERDEYTSSSLNENLLRLRTGKRGRPPIDPAQRGLAERRRKQVRKAQRAYRTRKDEEAAFRMNHVADLENRISRMRQSFFKLISHVTKAEIIQWQPNLARDIQNITRDFLSDSEATEPCNQAERNGEYINHIHSSDDLDSSRPCERPSIDASCATESPTPAAAPQQMPVPIHVSASQFPSTSFGIQTPLPRNFAQRLYFDCIKRAYYLLTNPYADRTEVARVFQYSFQCSNTNTMISTFAALLRANADYQTACVYGLGGAGTHYKQAPTELGIGQRFSLNEQTPFENESTWFDPRDIEGWLEENGLVIGGTQSFMYLSKFRFFGLSKDVILSPAPESLEQNTKQSAKILNVDQFLQELLSRGVCLGSAPGFRRLDVEAAFSLAISDETTFTCGR